MRDMYHYQGYFYRIHRCIATILPAIECLIENLFSLHFCSGIRIKILSRNPSWEMSAVSVERVKKVYE